MDLGNCAPIFLALGTFLHLKKSYLARWWRWKKSPWVKPNLFSVNGSISSKCKISLIEKKKSKNIITLLTN
jgi:hypothetical protein